MSAAVVHAGWVVRLALAHRLPAAWHGVCCHICDSHCMLHPVPLTRCSSHSNRCAGGGGQEHGGCGNDCEEEHDHGHGDHSHGEDGPCGADCADTGYDHGSGSAAAPPAWVRLVSCLHNGRDSHMMSGGDGEEGDEEGSSDEEEGSEGGCKCRRACWFQQAGAAWACGEVRKATLAVCSAA